MLACLPAGYMPPEVVACPLKRTPACNKLRTDVTYTSAVDVYAVGKQRMPCSPLIAC